MCARENTQWGAAGNRARIGESMGHRAEMGSERTRWSSAFGMRTGEGSQVEKKGDMRIREGAMSATAPATSHRC